MGPKKKSKNLAANDGESDNKPAPQLNLGSFLFPNEQSSNSEPQPTSSSEPKQTCSIKRTKKGNAPVTVENSFGGRKVLTLIQYRYDDTIIESCKRILNNS